ncbi:MAG: DNA polymerase IV [Candidatus Nealsonbacteria bacterium]|nr:DNA polymerase IV [Candidatus Nealsonbacteria bacterium]
MRKANHIEIKMILHIDMDCFFAQIETRENPRFKGKPVVIGADPKKGRGRGVVSTANYEARQYKIHSGQPISKAYRLCPAAIFIPPDMKLYSRVSDSVFKIVKKYSPKYEIVSLDEAYIDLSFLKDHDYGRALKRAKELALRMKKEILQIEELTSTIGIGSNKLIAKIAAQQAKPDGFLAIKADKEEEFLAPLDIRELPGVGPKTASRLRDLGINKIEELRRLSEEQLKNFFGRTGADIYKRSRGIDNRQIVKDRPIKSIGKEYTFDKNTKEGERIFKVFNVLIKDVYNRILRQNFCFQTITVKCRFEGFKTFTKSKSFRHPFYKKKKLQREAKGLLLKLLVKNIKPIRLIGVRVSNLSLRKSKKVS